MTTSPVSQAQLQWYNAAIQCHEADIKYLETFRSEKIPVPPSTSPQSQLISKLLLAYPTVIYFHLSTGFIKRNISSRVYQIALMILRNDVITMLHGMADPYVKQFDLFDEEREWSCDDLAHHQYCLKQAERKMSKLQGLSPKSLSDPLNKKEYPGVSLELLEKEDELPDDASERSLFLNRQVTRLNLLMAGENLRAAKAEEILNAVKGLTTQTSKIKVVAGAIALLAITVLSSFAHTYIYTSFKGLRFMGSILLLGMVSNRASNIVCAATGLDKLMQLSKCEAEIESRYEGLKKWKERFENYLTKLPNVVTIKEKYAEAQLALEALEAKRIAFYETKAKLGFLSSFLFTTPSNSSLLLEGYRSFVRK